MPQCYDVPFCAYPCEFHKGKVEWHHPISTNTFVGIFLCEAHHSILPGRKRRYQGETLIDKSLSKMKAEIIELETLAVTTAGYSFKAINKR